MKKEICLYFSVDSDDAFMFYALRKKIIDTGPFIFRFYQGDTEYLNNLAMEGKPDIIAVSIFTYGLIADKYMLLPHSGSTGRNYGPVVVSRDPHTIGELPDLKVATPGEKTTAHCIFKMLSPESNTAIVPITPFSEIFHAIDNKQVNAGILIHEGRLIYKDLGYHLIVDLGKWWFNKTGLPLPLGGTVINKNLGGNSIRLISSYLK
ncbi:MAG: MqnA/MqnD/SBP family protein, partial [Thermodesulfobacteriota bacterium]|nr:MqnA/MqnD/SBP family protein [Thermodesulfobacteriota bacterium]